MRTRRQLSICFGLVALCATAAGAQDKGKTGITMGYPASIGVIWHASDAVAIRPEFSIAGGTSESSPAAPLSSSSDTLSVGAGVSVLFYLHTYDHLRTYVSPRVNYTHTSSTIDISGITDSSSKTTGTSAGAAGSFGAQYALADKFSVFGEVGFGFSHATTKSGNAGSKITGNTWGNRAAVGVIFYP